MTPEKCNENDTPCKGKRNPQTSPSPEEAVCFKKTEMESSTGRKALSTDLDTSKRGSKTTYNTPTSTLVRVATQMEAAHAHGRRIMRITVKDMETGEKGMAPNSVGPRKLNSTHLKRSN